jgi:hypothetical protein
VPLVYWMLIGSSKSSPSIVACTSSAAAPPLLTCSHSAVPKKIARSSAGSAPRTLATVATKSLPLLSGAAKIQREPDCPSTYSSSEAR